MQLTGTTPNYIHHENVISTSPTSPLISQVKKLYFDSGSGEVDCFFRENKIDFKSLTIKGISFIF